MTSITYSSVRIQTSAQSVPAIPSWFGEVTLIVHYLRRQDVLSQIEKQVHFARRRFGHYDVIDFVAVLLGYAISGERTLEAFYQRVSPFASTFMALFGRDRLPARSTLSRFLAALTPEPVEALRALFLSDLLARPLDKEEPSAGLWDRQGTRWIVFDVDGTREAARQRALPADQQIGLPHRAACAPCVPPFYTGRKRGEVVRTRTTVLQMHTHQWLATDRAIRATDTIARSSAAWWQPSNPTCRPITFQNNTPSSVWMGNMAPEPFWRIWPDSPMSRVAKTIGCWIELKSRPACTCLLTSS